MDEKATRIQLIDKKLADAGWDVNDYSQVTTEFAIEKNMVNEPPLRYGYQFSDVLSESLGDAKGNWQ